LLRGVGAALVLGGGGAIFMPALLPLYLYVLEYICGKLVRINSTHFVLIILVPPA